MTAMPVQKPGKSEQEVVTPWLLIDAVEKRFGRIDFDLAATPENCRVRSGGLRSQWEPYFAPPTNSLEQDWRQIRGNAWLNPPYGRTLEALHGIADWAEKCRLSSLSLDNIVLDQPRIFLLVPAGTGANWYADHIWKKSLVLFLQGRVTFDGHPTPYPKDLILAVYGQQPGAEVWDWRKDIRK
jgi:hypothetical protein